MLLARLAARLVFDDNPFTGGIAAREASGRPIEPRHWAETWGWWAALANLARVAALLWTSRWWLKPDPAQPGLTVKSPELHAIVAEGPVFEVLETLWGSDPRGARRAYRCLGGSNE